MREGKCRLASLTGDLPMTRAILRKTYRLQKRKPGARNIFEDRIALAGRGHQGLDGNSAGIDLRIN